MSMKKASLAVFAMHRFVALQDGTPVSLEKLREQCGVSTSYLEQIFSGLLRAGLVTSFRGPGGGYICDTDITVAEVVSCFVTSGYMLTTPVMTALNGVLITDLPEGFSI